MTSDWDKKFFGRCHFDVALSRKEEIVRAFGGALPFPVPDSDDEEDEERLASELGYDGEYVPRLTFSPYVPDSLSGPVLELALEPLSYSVDNKVLVELAAGERMRRRRMAGLVIE